MKTVFTLLFIASSTLLVAQDEAEKLTQTLSGKTWEVVGLTSFDSANPNGISINSMDKLKASSRYMTFTFGEDGKLTCTGSPFAGGFTEWKVISGEEIEMSKPGKTSSVKILHLSDEKINIERENPLMRNKEQMTLQPKS